LKPSALRFGNVFLIAALLKPNIEFVKKLARNPADRKHLMVLVIFGIVSQKDFGIGRKNVILEFEGVESGSVSARNIQQSRNRRSADNGVHGNRGASGRYRP
jgi:hypothetical protein